MGTCWDLMGVMGSIIGLNGDLGEDDQPWKTLGGSRWSFGYGSKLCTYCIIQLMPHSLLTVHNKHHIMPDHHTSRGLPYFFPRFPVDVDHNMTSLKAAELWCWRPFHVGLGGGKTCSVVIEYIKHIPEPSMPLYTANLMDYHVYILYIHYIYYIHIIYMCV